MNAAAKLSDIVYISKISTTRDNKRESFINLLDAEESFTCF